uniref:RING-type E3 ubiquitin transferase n=1 Tax=Junco hyemalis TaxID=40217 RepID=A0A8C5NS77_JUNHY
MSTLEGEEEDPGKSPLQSRGSTDTEVEDRCPMCLDSWREPSFVMPCLHCFCYACILWWANSKTQCPLCKGKMTSILRAHRKPDAPSLHRPGAHHQWMTAGDVQHFTGSFQLPNWMSSFSANSAIQQTLHSWFCQSLEMLFETIG